MINSLMLSLYSMCCPPRVLNVLIRPERLSLRSVDLEMLKIRAASAKRSSGGVSLGSSILVRASSDCTIGV